MKAIEVIDKMVLDLNEKLKTLRAAWDRADNSPFTQGEIGQRIAKLSHEREVLLNLKQEILKESR
jgi:hypothetical protein